MNTPEKNAFIKASAVEAMDMGDAWVQIDDFTYAIPVTVEGAQRYAKVTITACNDKATKTTKAFDINSVVDEFHEKINTREETIKTKKTSKTKTKETKVTE